jgi:hypothetical protein
LAPSRKEVNARRAEKRDSVIKSYKAISFRRFSAHLAKIPATALRCAREVCAIARPRSDVASSLRDNLNEGDRGSAAPNALQLQVEDIAAFDDFLRFDLKGPR